MTGKDPERKTKSPKSPRITIEVTEETIRESMRRDSSHCIIAESLRAAYPDAQKVAVDIQTIRFSDYKKGLRYVYLTPRLAQVAIIDYDQGTTPAPFRFQLRGAQVCSAGRRPVPRVQSTEELSQEEAARVVAFDQLAKGRLVNRNKSKDRNTGIPERVGGKTPPVSIARRREFGLRAFDRLQ